MIEGTSAIQNALSGLKNASSRINDSAQNLAKFGTQDRAAGPIDEIDLSEEAVKLIQAETAYKANLEVIDLTREQQDALLDILDDDS